MLHTCGAKTQVKDSRTLGTYKRRYRYCPHCRANFTTYEITEEKFRKTKAIRKSKKLINI